jgi:hypothetical protein
MTQKYKSNALLKQYESTQVINDKMEEKWKQI